MEKVERKKRPEESNNFIQPKIKYIDRVPIYIISGDCVDDMIKNHAEGNLKLHGISFQFTINKIKDEKRQYAHRIRVCCISPTTKKILISEYKDKTRPPSTNDSDKDKIRSLEAVKDFRRHSYNLTELCREILLKSRELYKENAVQLCRELGKKMTPGTITFEVAKHLAIPGFMRSKDNDSRIRKKLEDLITYANDSIMSKSNDDTINEILKKANSDNSFSRTVLHDFFEYCIIRNICLGPNPVQLDCDIKQKSNDALNFNATMAKVLDPPSINALWDKLNEDVSFQAVAVALRLSGLSYEQILSLDWSAVSQINSYKGKSYSDFVIIRIYRDKLEIAMHNFSRPLIPPAAILLLRYKKNIKGLKKNDPVIPLDKTGNRYTATEIKNWENDFLAISGIEELLNRATNPKNLPHSSKIVANIYKSILLNECGLSNDNDTYLYLTGSVLRDSGAINYECHSNLDAQYKYYSILQHFQLKRSYHSRIETLTNEDDSKTKIIKPKTNHHVSGAIITVKLTNASYIKLLTEHGMTGSVCVKECNADDSIEKLTIAFDDM